MTHIMIHDDHEKSISCSSETLHFKYCVSISVIYEIEIILLTRVSKVPRPIDIYFIIWVETDGYIYKLVRQALVPLALYTTFSFSEKFMKYTMFCLVQIYGHSM